MKKMLPRFTIASLFLHVCFSLPAQKKQEPQLGSSPIKDVIKAMTIEEKVSLLVGTGMKFPGLPPERQGPAVGQTQDRVPGAAGTTAPIARLGIPSIVLADGPAGLRINPFREKDSSVSYYCTAFPIATLLSCSWDVDLVKNVGRAMGNEVKEYGVDVLLAPALNNHRNPLGGRNFEYYSEDPVVSGKMAGAMVTGIQSEGVGTSVKHFIANNHEWNRNVINVIAGERSLREIYLRGFELAIKEARPWTVMSSYNKVNGTYTSERQDLLTTVLRDEWGYKGFVMTDWFGGKDAVAQMKAGNDLLMPGKVTQYKALIEAVKNKTLDEAVLDKNVERILSIILQTPSFKKYQYSNRPDLKAHAHVARKAATEGMVLLKNEGVLPLSSPRKVAVFGNASYDMITGGTGSGDVNEAYTVSLTDGLKNAGFSINETLKANYNAFIKEQKEKRPKMRNPFLLPPPIAEYTVSADAIAKLADENDVAIITIGRNSGEFADRKVENDYSLSTVEKDLIKSVSHAFHAKGKKVVVLLNIGGAIEVASWRDLPDALLLAWQPGQEAGNAITDVISGKVNPSGKLVTTFPVDYKDVSSAKNFPGKVIDGPDSSNHGLFAGDKAAEVTYEEGIYTGYLYYSTFNVKPAYEFGYGLSYTHFNYNDLRLSSSTFNGTLTATVTITNSGKVAGKEVVQLYLSAPAAKMDKPVKELKAFAKTGLLQPGQSQKLAFILDSRDLASFDTNTSSWTAEAGRYAVGIGASSMDIRQTASFSLLKDIVVEKVHKVLTPQVPINEMKASKRI
jgi:beta-glucosidase